MRPARQAQSAQRRGPVRSGDPAVDIAWCRAAARSAERAEFGPPAVRWFRRRGAFGLVPPRGPLALSLLVASKEGRLVRRDEHSFAVLQSPAGRPVPYQFGGLWLSVLRHSEQHWNTVLLGVPPAAALLVAVALLPFRAMWIVAVLLVLAAICHVVVLMAAQLLHGLLRAVRHAVGRGGSEQTGDLPGEHWSMPFGHHRDAGGADDLLRQVRQRLAQLVVAQVELAAADLGGRARAVVSTEALTCPLAGATTARLRDAIRVAAEPPEPGQPEPAVAVIASLAGDRAAVDRPASGSFVFWYLTGMIVAILVNAQMVAGAEQDACPEAGCPGRPTTYLPALRWLSQRLLLSDPPDLSPATGQAWLVGWLTSLMALVAVPVAGVAIRQQWKANARKREQFHRRTGVTRQPTVLVLVAAPVERDAFLAVTSAAGTRPERRFLSHHTVFRLGSIGGTSVLLAQCEQGTLSPSASTLTAQSLIDRLAPDYLVLAGICYGLREDEQRLGDVLVSEQLRVIDHKKVVDETGPDGRVEPAEVGRGDHVRPSGLLLDRCQAATVDWDGAAEVRFGQILSGNVLVDSAVLRARLVAQHPEAIGGEMEGAGVYAAAAREKTDWILVKAISDWGYRKEVPGHPDDRRSAARNAAGFVVHMIGNGGLQEPPPDRRGRPG